MNAKLSAVFPIDEENERVIEVDYSNAALEIIVEFSEQAGAEELINLFGNEAIEMREWERPKRRPQN